MGAWRAWPKKGKSEMVGQTALPALRRFWLFPYKPQGRERLRRMISEPLSIKCVAFGRFPPGETLG